VGSAEHADAARARSLDDGRLTRSDDVLSRRIVSEVLIVRLEDEEYFGLSGVGARLWDLLGDGATMAELVATIADEYDVETAILERDVRAVLNQLCAADLLTRPPVEAP
jgi:hypothetical protein